MKEIKFRAWKHVNTPEMFNNVQAIDFKRGMAHLGYKLSSFTERTDKESLDNLILMQYTGLTDKNGKEIYEGDIVKQIPKEGYEHIIANGDLGIIKSSFGSCTIINAKDGRTHFFFYTEQEIIGNIYENPELLERK